MAMADVATVGGTHAGGTVLARPAAALREALTCPLCKDVLRAAYTAPECMHTYCFACVERVLFDDDDDYDQGHCPVCSRNLGRTPYLSGELRFDRALTALCMQIFPRPGDDERMQAAIAREEELRAELRRQQAAADARKNASTHAVRRRVGAHTGAPRPGADGGAEASGLPSVESATAVFRLRQMGVPSSGASPGAGETLSRPFLRTPPTLTAHALALYITSQLPSGAGQVSVCTRHGDPVVDTAQVVTFMHYEDAQPSGALPVVYFFCHGGSAGHS